MSENSISNPLFELISGPDMEISENEPSTSKRSHSTSPQRLWSPGFKHSKEHPFGCNLSRPLMSYGKQLRFGRVTAPLLQQENHREQ